MDHGDKIAAHTAGITLVTASRPQGEVMSDRRLAENLRFAQIAPAQEEDLGVPDFRFSAVQHEIEPPLASHAVHINLLFLLSCA